MLRSSAYFQYFDSTRLTDSVLCEDWVPQAHCPYLPLGLLFQTRCFCTSNYMSVASPLDRENIDLLCTQQISTEILTAFLFRKASWKISLKLHQRCTFTRYKMHQTIYLLGQKKYSGFLIIILYLSGKLPNTCPI